MDYATPSFRKSKGDKKSKRRFMVYKRGGKHRGENMKIISDKRGNDPKQD